MMVALRILKFDIDGDEVDVPVGSTFQSKRMVIGSVTTRLAGQPA